MSGLEHGLDENDVEVTPVRGFDSGSAPFSEASIVDIFQQEVEELASSKEVFIPVKGYERTGLQIKYHLPSRGKELEEIANKVRREVKDNWTRNITTAVDVIIHLCDGLYVQPTGVDEPVMLDPGDTGEPCMFDNRLAELMGMENVTSARQVVRRLFGNNDMAIINHSEKLNRWLGNTKADVTVEAWQQGE